jgi:hypothetical protein
MSALFVIGFLLIITTFTAYSKLGSKCTSDGLRSKLRWAIGLGTTFVTVAIGYTVCITRDGCYCDFGDRASWKIYTMLVTLMGMGGGLLALTIGINSDLKKDGCTVDLGITTDMLMGLSIAGMVIPAMYIAYIVVTGMPKGSSSKNNVNEDGEDGEEEDDESLALEASSRREAIDARRKARYNKSIAKKEEKLSVVRDKIEKALERGKSNPADKRKRDLLVKQLKAENSALSSVGSSVGGDSSDDDSSSSTTFGQWGQRR